MTHTYPIGGIIVSHLSNTSAPTPICWYPTTLGEVTAIDYCFDAAHFTGTGSNAVGYSVLAFQNGNYYRANWNNVFSTSWTSYSHTGLTASSFGLITTATPSLVDFSQNPDFGPSGGNIFFGFVSGNSHNTSGAIGVTTSGVDYFRLTVHHAVPEPSSALLGLGTLGLLARRRR